jgi:tetratricopeptide (TPR) repeat protein
MEHGRRLYAARQFDEAAAAFTQVISACRCGVPLRDAPCLCKKVLQGIESNSLRDELKKRCICSAQSDRRCDNAAHVDAMDSLAAVYEKTDRVDKALSCAEQMINLAPRDPKVYLRLAKVLRLQGSTILAYRTYGQGVELAGKSSRSPNSNLIPKLRELRDKMKQLVRTDPLSIFPLELVCMIFSHVDFRTIW